MRRKYQVTRNRVQLHNRLESLLEEEAHIKLSSVVSDLLGTSARRMLQALADGETDPATLAARADQRLRATLDQLHTALDACADLHPVYRRLVPRLGHAQAIGAITHRLCRLIWKILHQGVR